MPRTRRGHSADEGRRRVRGAATWRVGVRGLGLLVLAAACQGGTSGQAPRPTFEVDVFGSKSALDSYELDVAGLEAAPGPIFRAGRLVRTFKTSARWPGVGEQAYSLLARRQSVAVAEQLFQPYVCAEAFPEEQLVASQPLETHEVSIQEDGGLEAFTDFEHPLSFRCVAEGQDGAGASSGSSAPPRCPAEGATFSLRFTGSRAGVPFASAPSRCEAVLTDRLDGFLHLNFTLLDGGGAGTLSVAHCLPSGTEQYPLTLTAGESGCEMAVSFQAPMGETPLAPSRAEWTIEAVNFHKRGWVKGRLSADFSAPGFTLSVAGAFELPLLRVPLEFDWSER